MPPRPWWYDAVFYQIYPRSFADSNGDGIGDLPGITAHLDHLAADSGGLGVDAVWLSPFYPSPMIDFGYDIADYCNVDPIFGTLHDLDVLLTRLHALGLRLVIDFVPNHTSDRHSWFQASRADTTNPYRSWYHWADPAADGGPPNNWLSEFTDTGSAWTHDPATGQYYLHSFTRHQPDLNWANPDVQQAMGDVLRFWLDRGVDGFRVDVAQKMAKDAQLRDNLPGQPRHDDDVEDVHTLLRQFRTIVDTYPDRMLVGEAYVLDPQRMVRYLGEHDNELNLVFNFDFLNAPLDAEHIVSAVHRADQLTPAHAWPTWAVSNHDHPRPATRYDHDGHGADRARLAAMLLLTLRGTPFLYYGDELGMTDVPIPPERRQDPGCTFLGDDFGRDPARTPLPWNADPPFAGFSTTEPWLPLGTDYQRVNVATQQSDPASMLALYRRLIAYRRDSPALREGTWQPIATPPQVIGYERRHHEHVVVVLLNGADSPVQVTLAEPARIVLSTTNRQLAHGAAHTIQLPPRHGLILEPDHTRTQASPTPAAS